MNFSIVVPFKKHQLWVSSHSIIIKNNIVIEFNIVKQVKHFFSFVYLVISNFIIIISLSFLCTGAHDLRTVIRFYLDVLIDIRISFKMCTPNYVYSVHL